MNTLSFLSDLIKKSVRMLKVEIMERLSNKRSYKHFIAIANSNVFFLISIGY